MKFFVKFFSAVLVVLAFGQSSFAAVTEYKCSIDATVGGADNVVLKPIQSNTKWVTGVVQLNRTLDAIVSIADASSEEQAGLILHFELRKHVPRQNLGEGELLVLTNITQEGNPKTMTVALVLPDTGVTDIPFNYTLTCVR